MKINMILFFLRRTALFIATMFAFFVFANAGALAQSICKIGLGISIIIYIFLLAMGTLKSDIERSKELKDEKKDS